MLAIKKKLINAVKHLHRLRIDWKSTYWFGIGIILGIFIVTTFSFIAFEQLYKNVVFPGVFINGISVGGKTQEEIKAYFDKRNLEVEKTTFTFIADNGDLATVSAKTLHAGYDSNLLAQQAFDLGRSNNIISDISLVFQAYLNGIDLSPSFTYDSTALKDTLDPIVQKLTIDPVNALFTFTNNKVTAFHPSQNGQAVDMQSVKSSLSQRLPLLIALGRTQNFTISIPTVVLKPKVTTEDANNLGIRELIGSGTSLFQHSIASRIYNVTLAASRLNGMLVAPGEIFSFDKALGDVSAFTGYQQAYVIENGKTVLGDGGGVCQVSTTMFRAILNSGLPVIERHAHAYRVGYYEEDAPPGLDATVYVPSVDLKFKNDTGHYILIQTVIDPTQLRLTFNFYGTSDGRSVNLTTPVVTNEIPAPAPLYQDAPNLPKGTVQQTDFAANGATATFSRTVTKDGKTYIHDTYTSVYQPWQAVFLVGTM